MSLFYEKKRELFFAFEFSIVQSVALVWKVIKSLIASQKVGDVCEQ